MGNALSFRFLSCEVSNGTGGVYQRNNAGHSLRISNTVDIGYNEHQVEMLKIRYNRYCSLYPQDFNVKSKPFLLI